MPVRATPGKAQRAAVRGGVMCAQSTGAYHNPNLNSQRPGMDGGGWVRTCGACVEWVRFYFILGGGHVTRWALLGR
jgi:hypothetical protein